MLRSTITPAVFYYTDMLDENVVQYLNDLLVVKTEDCPSQVSYKQNSVYTEFNKDKKSESTKKLIRLIKPFFDRSGLSINENEGSVEYCSYERDYESDEDYQNQGDDVHICYLITKVDENKNNNIEICMEHPDMFSMLGFKDQKTREFTLQQGTVFIASGDTYYRFQELSGMNYICIVFHKKEEEDKEE